MIQIKKSTQFYLAKNQLYLYGYKDYFSSFAKLFKKNKLPNSMLFTGEKGLGKSTFVYHLINYLLSINEEKKYSSENLIINDANSSYKLMMKNVHPNFFLVESESLNKDIKIDQIKNLIKFINKSTYSRDLKLIMIDNAENLNLNSANSLLKSIEEPTYNTFFFVIHNKPFKILNTIKSRCNEFKIFFSIEEKKKIFRNLSNQYALKFDIDNIISNYYFETPGNLINYLTLLQDGNFYLNENTSDQLFHLIKKYNNEKNPQILSFLSVCIMKFYYYLFLNDSKNLNMYSFNLSKISKLINNMKKFNLNEKITLLSIQNILRNE